MAHIVMVWELGSGYGHIASMLPLAQQLERQGHHVSWIVSHPQRLTQLSGQTNCYQAPLRRSFGQGRPSLSLASVLLNNGFDDAEGQLGLCRDWLKLYAHLRPDLIIADHAPTAQLAALAASVPLVLYGTGYFMPPQDGPLAPLRWWQAHDEAAIAAEDNHLTVSLNHMAKALGCSPFESASELWLRSAGQLLCTLPELDHYPQRRDAEYWGPVASRDMGAPYRWPATAFPKVLVYLRGETPGLELILTTLSQSGCHSCVHIGGDQQPAISALDLPGVSLCHQPVQLTPLLPELDLVISHAGHGLSATLAMAGIKQLVLPRHTEQQMLAMRLHAQGLAMVSPLPPAAAPLKEAVQLALASPQLQAANHAFERHYCGFDQHEQLATMAEYCEELI